MTLETLNTNPTERHDVIVIGAGQSGLAAAHHLARRGVDFVVLEANQRVGDQWRRRYESLRLYSPARYDALPGLPFPLAPNAFPTGAQMADYLESYAGHFDLPVRTVAGVPPPSPPTATAVTAAATTTAAAVTSSGQRGRRDGPSSSAAGCWSSMAASPGAASYTGSVSPPGRR